MTQPRPFRATTRLPITRLGRTLQEERDVHLSWKRPDLNFFAAGACQILAFAFLERYPRAGFSPKFICPAPGFTGTHIYVTDGTLAFDAQGYAPEGQLLKDHRAAYRRQQRHWRADVLDIDLPLAHFCAANNHRAPWDFPPGVWQRAHAYLDQFPAPPSRA